MRSFNTAESAPRSTLPPSPFGLPPSSQLSERSGLRRTSRWAGHASRASRDAPRSTLHAPRASRAFTLIELLVVMVVMVVILTISLPAFINLGRGMSLRAAVNNVYATLALSRQWAITHREEITFVGSATGLTYNATNGTITLATNDHACYLVTNANGNVIQTPTDLPLDITFDASAWASNQTNLIFKADGGLNMSGFTRNIVLMDKRNPGVNKTITINVLTGGIRME